MLSQLNYLLLIKKLLTTIAIVWHNTTFKVEKCKKGLNGFMYSILNKIVSFLLIVLLLLLYCIVLWFSLSEVRMCALQEIKTCCLQFVKDSFYTFAIDITHYISVYGLYNIL